MPAARRWLQLVAVLVGASAVVMCGTSEERNFELPPAPQFDASPETGSFALPDAEKPCADLRCKVPSCGAGQTTSISGTVYAPNGTLPLYNAIVYVPNGALAPIPRGLTCDRCGALVTGDPIAATLTDSKGHFTLKDVPAGADIPLVMQIGKWRRMIKLPAVEACKDNLADPTDTSTDPRFKYSRITRLPRNQDEGDLPKIAVTTGGCDPIPCLMPKLGLDSEEYGGGFSPKAVNFYRGAGSNGPGNPPGSQELWSDIERLKQYDVILHSCECDEHNENKGTEAWEAMKNYVDLGGRLFTTDYGYTFIQKAPSPWSEVATWAPPPDGGFKPVVDGGDFPINQDFPKGKALAEWLDFTNGSTSFGNVTLPTVYDNALALDEARATRWVTGNANTPKVFTFNSPVGDKPEAQCGRVAFGDAHIFSQFENSVSATFPAGCREALNDREKVIAFLFFDITACVISDLVPQQPPEVVR